MGVREPGSEPNSYDANAYPGNQMICCCALKAARYTWRKPALRRAFPEDPICSLVRAEPNSFNQIKRGLRMLKKGAVLLLASVSMLWGQASTSLRGTITDPQGSAVADAAVTLSGSASGGERRVLSGKTGSYEFAQIPPGTYTVVVQKPGFSVYSKSELLLEVNVPATLDFTLKVGNTTETVSVEADAEQINTVDATVGNAFQQQQVRQLPLQTRNVVELLSIQPGVTATGEVLGGRRDQNNITLDGVDVNQNQDSGVAAGPNSNGAVGAGDTSVSSTVSGFNAALPVPLDSVEEFRVTVAGFGANQGRSSGGQVSLVTKSGTNSLHGSFYEYNRNTDLTANNWFSNRARIARQPLVRNQFGASMGGPIIKNRIFLFGNWERRIDASGQTVTRTLPSDNLRQGILTFKLTNGQVQTLSPAEIAQIDPLHLGFNPAMKAYFAALPAGNDPTIGADKGLNFTGLRFNAPFSQDDSAYVAKSDFNIDKARKHTVAVRGTLAGDAQTSTVGVFPGGSPVSQLLNNSRGISASYTYVIKPTLINVASYGLTRYSVAESGTLGTAIGFQSITSPVNYTIRPSLTQIPTHNFADDLTWIKGKHTISTGVNFRFITNHKSTYANSFASYSFSRNTLQGLGGDATALVTNFIRQRSGDPTLKLADTTDVQGGLGDILGLINQYNNTYQLDKTGHAIAVGAPSLRNFKTNEYEGYVQDSWRVRRDLTITAGLRYSNFSVPYETTGTEVTTTAPLEKYFAERVAAGNAGLPAYSIPDAALTYVLAGAANGKPGWYHRDTNNFGPRLAFAYSPEKSGGWLSTLLGKGSVIRGGAAMVYDRYGSDLIVAFDQTGSPGLANSVTQPSNTNFTSSARYSGVASLPALPAAPAGGFPYTPPTITGGFDEGVGISSNLVAPYSFVLNLNYAKELPGKITMEIGYAGRLSRKNLIEADFNQPLTNFKDQGSGQTFTQAAGILRSLYDKGITPAMVAANPNLVPNVAFFANQFPGLANLYFPGNAAANYFDVVYNQNAGSDLDALNQVDRDRTNDGFPNCITKTGCNTFYPLQSAGLPTWTNLGYSTYHAATLTIRRPLSHGIGFDFNYTLGHSIDNSSGVESGAGDRGAVLQDAFNPSAFRGSSDFDARHTITTDILLGLPFGHGAMFFNNAPGWMNQIIGGWQLSVLGRYRSGLPTTIGVGGVYPVNYEISALAIPKPGTSPTTSIGFDQNGLPSLFGNTNAASNFIEAYPGQTGTRAIIRGPGTTNFDMTLGKTFPLPWEGHRVQFRAEAFNALNNVNFYSPSLNLSSPAKFGEFSAAQAARVVQLSLRYEF